MAAVTFCSEFGAQKNKVSHCCHGFPIYLPWSGGTLSLWATYSCLTWELVPGDPWDQLICSLWQTVCYLPWLPSDDPESWRLSGRISHLIWGGRHRSVVKSMLSRQTRGCHALSRVWYRRNFKKHLSWKIEVLEPKVHLGHSASKQVFSRK